MKEQLPFRNMCSKLIYSYCFLETLNLVATQKPLVFQHPHPFFPSFLSAPLPGLSFLFTFPFVSLLVAGKCGQKNGDLFKFFFAPLMKWVLLKAVKMVVCIGGLIWTHQPSDSSRKGKGWTKWECTLALNDFSFV